MLVQGESLSREIPKLQISLQIAVFLELSGCETYRLILLINLDSHTGHNQVLLLRETAAAGCMERLWICRQMCFVVGLIFVWPRPSFFSPSALNTSYNLLYNLLFCSSSVWLSCTHKAFWVFSHSKWLKMGYVPLILVMISPGFQDDNDSV